VDKLLKQINNAAVSTLRYVAICWYCTQQTADCSTWFAWCTLGSKICSCDVL